MDVRVNGEATEDLSVSPTPASPLHSPQESEVLTPKPVEKEPIHEEEVKDQEAATQPPPPQTEKSSSSSGSTISSLMGGRNCVVKTTIVTELTQTIVEPHHPEQSNGQVSQQTTPELHRGAGVVFN